MAFDWLNHKELKLIKGIGKTPGDSSSNEIDPVVVNLMGGAITLDSFAPGTPAVKSDGIWSDSVLSDGRQLLSAAAGNVAETIRVVIKDDSQYGTMKQFRALNAMALDCRAFWESDAQYNPVYLDWWAGCGAGPQYALIYDIQLKADYVDAPTPTLAVTIQLEREPYWRGLPPGANPRLWTLYKASKTPTTSNVNLVNQTDDLVYDTALKNRFEWDTAYSAPLSRNYVDIPASLLDGDAPALVSLVVQATTDATNPTSSVFLGRSTRPTSLKDHNGSVMLQSCVFNAGDCMAPASWTKTADATCGCISNGSGSTKYIGRNTALATGTYNQFASWSFFNSNNFVNLNLLSGRYAVFWRCKQRNGAAGDIQARIRINDNYGSFVGDYQNLPLVAGSTTTCENRFDLLYLGAVTLPLNGNVNSAMDGRGIAVQQKNSLVSTAAIYVDVLQNNASTRSIDFLDLVFIPISEQMVNLLPGANGGGSFTWYLYDNTGYWLHGQNFQNGKIVNGDPSSISSIEGVMETRGQDLTLVPNVNNRLYFMYQRAPAAGGSNFSAPDSSNDFASVRINIVPRWIGIRDV